jgi:hypothetical protein
MSGLVAFTIFHVVLSFVAIGLGFVTVYGLLNGRRMGRFTAWFLIFTAATTFTGFLFPFKGFTPALGTGIVSSVLLVLAVVARYRFKMAGHWRAVYITSAIAAFYLNCFVFVVQAFQKVPALHALAPDGAGPVFAGVQAVVLLTFVVVGYAAVKRFRWELARV